jgi:hypothetical protein
VCSVPPENVRRPPFNRVNVLLRFRPNRTTSTPVPDKSAIALHSRNLGHSILANKFRYNESPGRQQQLNSILTSWTGKSPPKQVIQIERRLFLRTSSNFTFLFHACLQLSFQGLLQFCGYHFKTSCLLATGHVDLLGIPSPLPNLLLWLHTPPILSCVASPYPNLAHLYPENGGSMFSWIYQIMGFHNPGTYNLNTACWR